MAEQKVEMKFGSGFSTRQVAEEAAREAVLLAKEELGAQRCDLVLLFITMSYEKDFELVSRIVREETGAEVFLGLTCESIIGRSREIERTSAISVFCASLPGVEIVPFYITQSELELMSRESQLEKSLGVNKNQEPTFILLPDPFTIDVKFMVDAINQAYPDQKVLGGMASGATEPGANVLFFNDEMHQEGAVGAALYGNLVLKTIVSQGCRPIGEPFIVTQAHTNVIQKLAGEPALAVLQKTLEAAPEHDRDLAKNAIFVGRAIDEYKQHLSRGDFLIRNLMGVDAKSGAIAVTDFFEPGQTIQFHVRDGASAHEDLELLLKAEREQGGAGSVPRGALVFSCNGRGSRLFEESNHDIGAIQKYLGPFPAAGFFAAGEIGPVGSRNFIHGFTASIGLFFPKK